MGVSQNSCGSFNVGPQTYIVKLKPCIICIATTSPGWINQDVYCWLISALKIPTFPNTFFHQCRRVVFLPHRKKVPFISKTKRYTALKILKPNTTLVQIPKHSIGSIHRLIQWVDFPASPVTNLRWRRHGACQLHQSTFGILLVVIFDLFSERWSCENGAFCLGKWNFVGKKKMHRYLAGREA